MTERGATSDWFAHESAVLDEGCSIGAGCKIWHFSHIMPGAVLGEGCNIGQNVVISPDVVLGRNCKVQNNVSLYTGVTCEDDVFLGPSCVFTNITNPRSAVVTKDVPPYALVVGNPAQHVGWMSAFGHRLEFDGSGRATCPESGESYELVDGTVRPPDPTA